MPLRIRVPSLGSVAGAAYTLTASPGSFAITGVAANLLAARVLAAGTGSFAITGNATGLLAGRVLSAGVGTFTITGIDATLTVGTPTISSGAGWITQARRRKTR